MTYPLNPHKRNTIIFRHTVDINKIVFKLTEQKTPVIPKEGEFVYYDGVYKGLVDKVFNFYDKNGWSHTTVHLKGPVSKEKEPK